MGAGLVHDAVECGRTIRVLSVVDAYTRECLALEVDTSFASRRVTRVLEGIIAERGLPQTIRCDNGPELTSRHFLAWGLERKIELAHIQPGKPMQNGRLESFNGKLREECLNISWFQNLLDARVKIAAWRKEYNEARPHSSLGYKTPKEFAAAQAAGFYTAVREARDSDGRCYETHWGSENKDAKMRANEGIAEWLISKASSVVSTPCFQRPWTI